MTDLTWIAGLASIPASAPVVSTAGSVAPAWRRYRAALAVAALVMLATVVFGAFLPRRQEVAAFPAVQFRVLPPQGSRFITATGNRSVPTVSPDGRCLATVATEAGNGRIWVLSFDSTEGQVLAGTEGANGIYGRRTAAPCCLPLVAR